MMRLHVRAVVEHHAELDAAILHEVKKPIPDAGTRPADEDLEYPL